MVKEAIDSGKLGKIVLADASVKWWRKQHYYDVANWRGTWAMDGGGSLMNQGVHTVDVLQWLTGGIESVFGHTMTAAHDIETEDIAVAALNPHAGEGGLFGRHDIGEYRDAARLQYAPRLAQAAPYIRPLFPGSLLTRLGF